MISVRIIMLVEWVCPDYVVSMASNFAALKVLLMFAYSISMKIHYMLFLKHYGQRRSGIFPRSHDGFFLIICVIHRRVIVIAVMCN